MKTMKQRALGFPAFALAAALALPALAGAASSPAGENPHQILVRAPAKTRVVLGSMGRGGYLGVQLLDLTEELREFYGAPRDAGILISRVVADSPAATAGFEVGDVITGIGGEPTHTSRDVMREVARFEPEDQIAVEVIRAGAPLTVNATLGEREGGVWFSRGFGEPELQEFHFEMPEMQGLEALRDLHLPGTINEETREAVREAMEAARERMSEIDFEGLQQRLAETEARLRELEKKLGTRTLRAHRCGRGSAGTAWNADLRSAPGSSGPGGGHMAGLVRVVKRERNEPPSRTARRFAPGIATPLRACGARRRVAMRRYFLVKGGVPPFTLSPRSRGQRTKFAAISFFRAWLTAAHTRWRVGKTTPPPHRHGDAQERERRPLASSPGGGRHSPPPAGVGKDPDVRDGSPLGADPGSAGDAQARERRPPVGTRVERPGRGDMAGLVRVVKRERNEPPSRTARRFAPGIATPLRACGARRRVGCVVTFL